jgi:primosomal protein N' (replication factor Y)
LTPQLTDRFQQRFGDRVCVYHSGLSDGERYDAWRRLLQGEPMVTIGTRSAVFAPVPQLGIIILDEEHDGSFKQDQPMPCYHARTVAQWRAELEACPLVLGSATPSLETWVALQTPEPLETPPAEPTATVSALSPLPRAQQTLSGVAGAHSQASPPPVTVVDMRLELKSETARFLAVHSGRLWKR